MMQNQPLPHTVIGEAYYARQIWLSTFGIVIHRGEHSTQSIDDTHFYRWTENVGGKGSNEIISCLDHFLRGHLGSKKKIRLFSDSCPAQNKNYAMLLMLQKLATERGVEIEWFFPEKGHSFIPVDRTFGRVEQLLKKEESILLPLD